MLSFCSYVSIFTILMFDFFFILPHQSLFLVAHFNFPSAIFIFLFSSANLNESLKTCSSMLSLIHRTVYLLFPQVLYFHVERCPWPFRTELYWFRYYQPFPLSLHFQNFSTVALGASKTCIFFFMHFVTLCLNPEIFVHSEYLQRCSSASKEVESTNI